MKANLHNYARILGAMLLLGLGGWILHSYLGLLAWAVVLAISTWPLFRKLQALAPQRAPAVVLALLLTTAFGLLVLGPIAYGLLKLVDEAQALAPVLEAGQSSGIPAPEWLLSMPWIGARLGHFWDAELGSPQAAMETLRWLQTDRVVSFSKDVAAEIVNRFFGFLITLLALFFVYRDGDRLGEKVLHSCRKLFGDIGVRYAAHACDAIRATVNGLVLVALAEGLLLGFGYALAGLSQPATLGTVTGVLGMIPFAAKLVLAICSMVLFAQGKAMAAFVLLVYGFVVIVVADQYIRPILIGGAVRVPFLWTLLAIFGGLENFGLLGMFLGPIVMAVLMSLWRDWSETTAAS
jgi:predicted PurR-regulated permease PerM